MDCTQMPGGEPMKQFLEAQGYVCKSTSFGWRCTKTVIQPDGTKKVECRDVLK